MDDSIIHINNDTSENEQLLKAMGFNDEDDIRQALKLSKNDINEAVAYLTNEKMPKLVNTKDFNSTHDDNEIIMSDAMMTNDTNQNFKRFNSTTNNDNNLDISLTNNVNNVLFLIEKNNLILLLRLQIR
jgi:hypothetical protein